MRVERILCVLALSSFLVACVGDPTSLEVPPGAQSVQQTPGLGGRAFQTEFTLRATYPETPALDFYRARIGKPWVLCQWSPEWSHFVDATTETRFDVYQQLHMWVNAEQRRTLTLSMRYHSPEDSGTTPKDDTQHVVLVENMGASVDDTIRELKLRCPGHGVVAS